MTSLLWGIDSNVWLQTFSGPVLDLVVTVVTAAGSVEFYLVFLPVVYWCVNKRTGIALTYAFLISAYFNTLLKGLIATPRPYQAFPSRVSAIATAEGYAFPSAHAQSSVTVWGYLSVRFGGRFWIAAACIPLAVGISRIYLGVHSPADVLGGWTIGAACVAAFVALESRIARFAAARSFPVLVAASLVVPLVLALLSLNTHSIKVAAALSGSSIGILLEGRYVSFVVAGSWQKRVLRYVLGAGVALALHVGLKYALPSADESAGIALSASVNAPRYFLVGVWVSFVAPWVFVKTRLAERSA